jgi:hypothetical protein
MSLYHLTNTEIAERLAHALRAWRISPQGAAMSQVDLAHKSGIGLTPLKRFEKTGAITLRNLVALLRALNLLDGLETLVPEPDAPGPLALLAAEQKKTHRKRAPRTRTPRASTSATRAPRASTSAMGAPRTSTSAASAPGAQPTSTPGTGKAPATPEGRNG